MDKDNQKILNIELKEICDCLTIMIEANRYIKNYYYYDKKQHKTIRPADNDSIGEREQKIKDYQYSFHNASIEFTRLINQYFRCNPNSRLNGLRVEYSLKWGTIHVKQPLNPFTHINEESSRVIVLEETIQRLRWDLGVGGCDLRYKPNLIDIAL